MYVWIEPKFFFIHFLVSTPISLQPFGKNSELAWATSYGPVGIVRSKKPGGRKSRYLVPLSLNKTFRLALKYGIPVHSTYCKVLALNKLQNLVFIDEYPIKQALNHLVEQSLEAKLKVQQPSREAVPWSPTPGRGLTFLNVWLPFCQVSRTFSATHSNTGSGIFT